MSLQSGYARQSAIEALALALEDLTGCDPVLSAKHATSIVDQIRALARVDRLADVAAILDCYTNYLDSAGELQGPKLEPGDFTTLKGLAEPMRIFAAAPDGNTTITERPPER